MTCDPGCRLEFVAGCETFSVAKATGHVVSAGRAPLGYLCTDRPPAMEMRLGQHREKGY